MPQVVFLLGGTGNQLFQISTSAPDAVFSPFFTRPLMCRILGWTQHEQIMTPPKSNAFLTFFALCVLAVDVLRVRRRGRTWRTDLNTRSITHLCTRKAWVRLGYFHHLPQTRSVEGMLPTVQSAPQYDVAIHFRGGDTIAARANGVEDYGTLEPAYYEQIAALSSGRIALLTDDPAAAQAHFEGLPFYERVDILKVELDLTLQIAVTATTFLSCPSTLSYWICQMRGGRGCIVQTPFLRTNARMSPKHSATRPARFVGASEAGLNRG